MSNETAVPAVDKVSKGFILWIGATFAAVVALSMLGGILSAVIPSLRGMGAALGPIALVQVGAWQWLYVVPLIIWLRRKQQFEAAKGLLITACVLFGVDVLCSGIVFYSLSHTSFH